MWARFSVLVIACALLAVLAAFTHTLPSRSDAPPPADCFLFVRHDTVEGKYNTDTLVVATTGRDGVELRDVVSQDNLDIGLHPIAVVGDRLYAAKLRDLVSIGLAEGGCTSVARDVRAWDCVEKRVFACTEDEIRECDLQAEAWRSVATLPKDAYIDHLAVSPDGAWVAFLLPAASAGGAGGYQLTVIDTATGQARSVGGPTDYTQSFASSYVGPPPLAWLDQTTLLFVRTDRDTGNAPTNFVVAANVATDQVHDVVALPGSAFMVRVNDIAPLGPGGPLSVGVWGHGPGIPGPGHLRVDVGGGELIETDSIGGEFRQRAGDGGAELLYGDRLLDQYEGPVLAAVSPDLRRVIWVSRHAPASLRLYDADTGAVETVCKGWFGDTLFWFSSADRATTPQPQRLAAGWHPLEHSEYPRPLGPDLRKPIGDYLTLEIACDKQTYALHEPVQLTLSLTNCGDLDLTVARPEVDERVLSLARYDLGNHGGGRALDTFWGSEELHPLRRGVLKPGATLTTTSTVEPPRPGAYRLESEYRTQQVAAEGGTEFRGRVTAKTEFSVEATADADRLLEEKVARLLTRLREEQATAPDWDGWLPTVDDLEEAGEDVAPYLVAALEDERNPRLVARYLRVLRGIASPLGLPFFRDAVASADEGTRQEGIAGLLALASAESPPDPEAVAALAEAVTGAPTPPARLQAARSLARVHDAAVLRAFEPMALARDPDVGPISARYVAAWEERDLADWLALVEGEPTELRLIAVQAVTADLQATWHLDGMPDLKPFTWDRAADGPNEGFAYAVRAWREWVLTRPRLSETYFADDWRPWRETARRLP